jgi:hypothetical protein
MFPELQIPVSTAGMLAAIACVVAGGPWFADGLRALRLRRLLASLRERPLNANLNGLVQIRGRVALESPLFSPLSARPCAGFLLEAVGEGIPSGGAVRELRPFRLVSDEGSALVAAEAGDWQLPVTAERILKPGDALSAHLTALLHGNAEMQWLLGRGVTFRLVERALESGAAACVTGFARASSVVVALPVPLAATGTDGASFAWGSAPASTPDVTVGGEDALDLLVVSDRVPEPAKLWPSRWRTLGVVLGPSLALTGLLYLAHAADTMLAGRV